MEPNDNNTNTKDEMDIVALMDQVDKELRSRPRRRKNNYEGPSFSYRPGMTWSEREEVYQRKIEAMYTNEQQHFMCNQVQALRQTFFGTTRYNWHASDEHIANVILRQYWSYIRPALMVRIPYRPVDWVPRRVWEEMLHVVQEQRHIINTQEYLKQEMWPCYGADVLDKMERAPMEIQKIKLGSKKKSRRVRK
jgi:hypothetical protein